MANYLFLLGMYHPRSSANGVCCKNIIDELIRQGNHVTCVVNDHYKSSKVELIDGAHIYRIKPKLYYRFSEWLLYHPNCLFKGFLNKLASYINKIYLFSKSSDWPFVSPSYTNRIYQKAQELCQTNTFDAIIAEYTPIDTLYAGYMIKKKFPNIKFIPYYLDALAGGWGPANWSKEKTEHHTRLYEMKINSIADLVVSMSSSRQYHEANPLSNSSFFNRIYLDVPTLVLNTDGTNSKNIKKTLPSQRKIALYSGSIHYPDRNPIPLLEHFLELSKKIDIELWFMGVNNCPEIFSKYNKLSDNKIKNIGQFPHKQALEKIAEVDFLVNIGNTNPNTVTSKIFEYMQFKKPIISTYQIEDEPAIVYLQKYKNYFLLDERSGSNFKKINEELRNFVFNENRECIPNLNKIFYSNTPLAFIDALNTLYK